MIENSFSILAARWNFLCQPSIAKPENVALYVKAAVALHNFLRTEESSVYCPPGFMDSEGDGCGYVIEGAWRQDEEGSTAMTGISHTCVHILETIVFPVLSIIRPLCYFRCCQVEFVGDVIWL